jgi:hypothetical protein
MAGVEVGMNAESDPPKSWNRRPRVPAESAAPETAKAFFLSDARLGKAAPTSPTAPPVSLARPAPAAAGKPAPLYLATTWRDPFPLLDLSTAQFFSEWEFQVSPSWRVSKNRSFVRLNGSPPNRYRCDKTGLSYGFTKSLLTKVCFFVTGEPNRKLYSTRIRRVMHQESGIHFKFLFAWEAAQILVASRRFFGGRPMQIAEKRKGIVSSEGSFGKEAEASVEA